MGAGLSRVSLRTPNFPKSGPGMADAKLHDAQIPLQAGRHSNACYLAAYAVEIGLKACIAAGTDPAIDGLGARGRRQGASLNLAPEASTILLSSFQNPCYGASFDQKTPPIAAEFSEAGMVDLMAAGRRTGEPKRENRGRNKKSPLGVRASP